MLRRILFHGLIAGLVAGIPLSIIALTSSHQSMAIGMLVGYLTMLVGFSAIFIAIKRQRDAEGGGVIGFWPAFGLGLGISLVAGIVYALAWELAQSIGGMDFAGDWARSTIAAQQAKGASPEALAKLTAEMEEFKRQYAKLSYRLPMTFAEIFPVGLLVSLISAGLLRNPRFLPLKRG